MKKRVLICSLIASCILFVNSCSKKDTAPDTTCDNVPKNFTADVNPLIQTYCNQAACHDANSINGPGPLTSYTEVFAARVAIRGAVQAGLMPQNTVLTTAQKNIIICWIDSGAPNN
jgi:PBP1b-binding outer membrane lipoprotein LpoB